MANNNWDNRLGEIGAQIKEVKEQEKGWRNAKIAFIVLGLMLIGTWIVDVIFLSSEPSLMNEFSWNGMLIICAAWLLTYCAIKSAPQLIAIGAVAVVVLQVAAGLHFGNASLLAGTAFRDAPFDASVVAAMFMGGCSAFFFGCGVLLESARRLDKVLKEKIRGKD